MSGVVGAVLERVTTLVETLTPFAHQHEEPYTRSYQPYDEGRESWPPWEDPFRFFRVTLQGLEPVLARVHHGDAVRELQVRYAVDLCFPVGFPHTLLTTYLTQAEWEITVCLCDPANWVATDDGSCGPAVFLGAEQHLRESVLVWRLLYRQSVMERG